MAANMELAKQKGLSDEAVMKIDTLHDHLDCIIDNISLDHDEQEVADHVRKIEFELQALWGFNQDARYHTWVKRVYRRFRQLQYLGAVYRCNDSHQTRTIDNKELDGGVLVSVGNGFIDFGGVVRIVGNLERVK